MSHYTEEHASVCIYLRIYILRIVNSELSVCITATTTGDIAKTVVKIVFIKIIN
jgi:hypothetical protein